jgi:uncharacterized cupin superfamily protein
MTVIRQADVTPVETPPHRRAAFGRKRTWELSDAGGLTQFGAYLQVLDPGARTSDRHWHEREDEFLYVVAGTPTVIENDGPHLLQPGDACCWPGGVANAHTVENRSDAPCSIIILGTRVGDDRCHYPDLGRTQIDEGEDWRVVDDATGEILRSGKR